MPLDPQLRPILEGLDFDHAAQLTSRSVADAIAFLRSGSPPPPAQLVRWEDRFLPLNTRDVAVRIYWPDGQGPFPILMNFHGGGWVTGSIAGDDLRCQRLCRQARCVTISVDYRLAPEHPFPAAFEDCREATRWAHDHAGEIGGDPMRIAVSGASAGANLAAAVATRLHAEGESWPAFQLLYYPVIDATAHGGDIEGGPYYLSRAAMDWYWAQYLQSYADRRDPRISPIHAPDASRHPPALVIAAELDPLAAEARAFCATLTEAGVTATYVEMPGMIHGFISFGPELPQTIRAIDLGARALLKAFEI